MQKKKMFNVRKVILQFHVNCIEIIAVNKALQNNL